MSDTTPANDRPASDAITPSAPQPAVSLETAAELSSDMASQIEAAMKDLDAAPAEPRKGIRGPRVVHGGREHRKGKVISVGPTDVFIEFGPREIGVVTRQGWADEELPAVGDELEVVVERFDQKESVLICVRPGAVQKADWELLQEGQVVEAPVVAVVKGGIELEISGHRAFMPASQVSFERIENFEPLVGQKLTCQVQRIDRRGRGNIVLSRKPILAKEREEKADKLRESLHEGQEIEGTVRKIMPFGAFVDLGGVDGLIHISDLSHDRIGFGEKAVQKIVKEGQTVRVQVLKVDWDEKRIALGMKQLADDPFSTAVKDVNEGDEVTGKVKSIVDFGCFVEISPGLEGLVHISEIAHRRVHNAADVVKPDEVVRCKVLKIDPQTRRMSLSIKALQEAPKSNRKGKEDSGPSREEILKETPALRRMREKAKSDPKSKKDKGKGGLEIIGGGLGLGDLKLPG
ncbi:MAG: S1 RNA-binding domain-containing protein [Phycisphaeraceae bacterium]|nr:S1 RNA-binding domain-containing protein [Phycisphaerales bacterium]MCB9860136.1 S1 RNA-binding domain-containing protein [Phycisphaeraceae bacterium]